MTSEPQQADGGEVPKRGLGIPFLMYEYVV